MNNVLATSRYGAKVQSFAAANPRDLLQKIVDATPRAPVETLHEQFRNQILYPDNAQHLDAVIEYWFANNYRSLVRGEPLHSRQTPQERRQAVETAKAVIRTRATAMVLLELAMPNGKALGDCTGAYVAKAGGWLAKLAAKVGAKQKVRDVLSERQVRSIFQAAK